MTSRKIKKTRAKTKPSQTKPEKKQGNAFLNLGRRIGARRFLFVCSAAAMAVALFLVVPSAVQSFNSNYITDMSGFIAMQFLYILFHFMKLFVPAFLFVVVAKFVFDNNHRDDSSASETLRLAFFASVILGLIVAALQYLNAGHIIGSNGGYYCQPGIRCLFNWGMVMLAGRAFLASAFIFLMGILGLRGIYSELSFMLAKKPAKE